MHWHSLPAARGCAVGRPRRRAAAHPPLRPPTLAYSPICPPRSSRSSEPPEEVGHRSRGSRGGWAPDRRGCPGSRGSRPQRRRRPLVAPHWSWAMLVVSWRLGAPRHRRSLPIGSSCSDEVGSLAGAWREAVSMPPPRLRLPTPSPRRTPGIGENEQLRCPLGEKGSFPKMTLDTPYRAGPEVSWGSRRASLSSLHGRGPMSPAAVSRSSQ